jgi:hypothetical protein
LESSRRLKGQKYRDKVHADTVLDQKPPKAPTIKHQLLPEVVITTKRPEFSASHLLSDDDQPIRVSGAKRSRATAREPIIISDDDYSGSESNAFEAEKSDVDDLPDDIASSHDDVVTESEGSTARAKPSGKGRTAKPAKTTNKTIASKKRRSDASSDGEDDNKVPPAKKRKVTKEKIEKPAAKIYPTDPWNLQSKVVRNDWTEMTSPPLELFQFNRLVVDEYTYLEGRAYSVITNLKSNHRWILSGTPPVQDFVSVKTISDFMGVHLGISDDFWEGQSKDSIREAKRRQKDQTSKSGNWMFPYSRSHNIPAGVETFHSFREVHSLDWHARRNQVAQRFLDHFVRQVSAIIENSSNPLNISELSSGLVIHRMSLRSMRFPLRT